jgi:hypothetical protein
MSPHIAWRTKRATARLRIGLLLKKPVAVSGSLLERKEIFAGEISRVSWQVKEKKLFRYETRKYFVHCRDAPAPQRKGYL